VTATAIDPAIEKKFDTGLAMRLREGTPEERHNVIVRFAAPPDAAGLPALGLRSVGGDLAAGMLDRAGVLAVARRDDVLFLEFQPEPQPY
jgi:hypothetical protein